MDRSNQFCLSFAFAVWTVIAFWLAVVVWGGSIFALGTIAAAGLAVLMLGEWYRRDILIMAGGALLIAGMYLWTITVPFAR